MTTTLVKPVTCKRCGGSGNLKCRREHLGVPGTCFKCDGAGVVEGDAATLRAAREAREAAHKAWEATPEGRRSLARNAAQKHSYEAWRGLVLLEGELSGPARFERAVQSILTGHPRVMAALEAEYRTRILGASGE